MKHIIITFFLFIVSLPIFSFAENNFNILDVKSGISDNYIQSILKDKYGFMWYATKNGLNRYDGYHFKKYTIIDLGSYNNSVEWIKEDASGRIWIKTAVNYCFYNREKDIFENNLTDILDSFKIKEPLTKLFIDNDNNIWFITPENYYYYSFDRKEMSIIPIDDSINILDLSCKNDKAFILSSDGRIYKLNNEVNEFKNIYTTTLIPELIHNIFLDTEENLWIYSIHSSNLLCYSTKNNKVIDFQGKNNIIQENTIITNVEEDNNGNIWIGTDNNGIYITNIYNKSFSHIFKKPKKLFSLPNNHITCFFKDDKDIMWVGTSKQGVIYTSLNNNIFDNNTFENKEDLSCILEDANRNLWFGFDGEGIACKEYKSNDIKYFNSKDGTIPSNLIVCSYLDSKGRIWWGSFGYGPFYYLNNKFEKLSFNTNKTQNNYESPLYIRRITEDKSGNIWFATFTQGVFCLKEDGVWDNYNYSNSSLVTNYIADISCVDDRNLYIATSSGLYNMDLYTKKIIELNSTKEGVSFTQDKFVNCLYSDSYGLLWIGGREGLNIYDKVNDKVYRLTVDNGLSNNNIRAIKEDINKDIWVATDHGISHIKISKDHISNIYNFFSFPYYEKDGIGDYTFNNFSITNNIDNEIMIGGSGGYLKIKPRNSHVNLNNNNVTLTGFYIANKRIEVNDTINDGRVLLKKNIQLLNEITLNHYDNNFSFEVSAMDYENLHKLQYAYRLSDNDEWIKLEGNRIYFNKLSPGKYKLQIKVLETNNNANNQTSYFYINILPPVWFSFKAYFIYSLIILLLMIIVFLRVKHKHNRILKRQKKDLEIKQVNDMNEAKMKFFTNVSHDLRTPLSLIITPAQRLMSQNNNSGSEEIRLIYKNAVILMEEINQLLDFRKIDKKKLDVTFTKNNFSSFIYEIGNSFNEILYNDNNVSINIDIKKNNIISYFDISKMKRVIINLLSNAIKYNIYNGQIDIELDEIKDNSSNKFIILKIADTGIGIKNKDKIFERFYQEQCGVTHYAGSGIGLNIVKEYIDLHNGKIDVEDNNPQGTVFIITIPVIPDTDNDLDTNSMLDTNDDCNDESLVVDSINKIKPNILIVEDNDDFRKFLYMCLSEKYNVIEAIDGMVALEILANNNIDIIISDVMMPNMDGLELCQRIKQNINYSHIPIILLTAKSAEKHILNGLKEGADDYITKPFNLEILLLRIDKLLTWTYRNHQKFGKIQVSPSEITVSHIDELLIEKAIKSVENNMDNSEYSVEDLSSDVGMTRGHLYKKLMSITGKSPIEFIRILRVKRGKQLLEQSQKSVSEISYEIGLSPKQFAKYFKEEFGSTPSIYKKENSNEISTVNFQDLD